jgi:hypothetical protein
MVQRQPKDIIWEPQLKSVRGGFNTETNLHFPGGREGLHQPTVWLFSEVVRCLDCGFAQFEVPENELLRLRDGTAVRRVKAPSHRE